MKKINLAVAAALALGASAAQAGITIPAGDWTIDIGGNVNAYYTHTKTDGVNIFTGTTLTSSKANTIGTGLLPAALGIGGKTRQNDLDIAFQFTFFTGTAAPGAAASSNTLNIRQAFLTFGDKSWGTIKAGRDLGIFGSDAILSDMTLLGVGVGGPAGGSSTLGRIGSGYVYADWIGQIQYASPNWNGFSFAAAVREPWANGSAAAAERRDMGFDGKVNYEWAGDFAGKVWLGGLTQKHRGDGVVPSYTSRGWELGGKVGFSGAELVGYYYDGKGLDSQYSSVAGGLQFLQSTNKTDDNGGYVQATFKIPGVGTKLGASWGKNESEVSAGGDKIENESWIIGAYHPLTKSLNLVAEYTDQSITRNITATPERETNSKTFALGAIMFF
jgi:predicted porin